MQGAAFLTGSGEVTYQLKAFNSEGEALTAVRKLGRFTTMATTSPQGYKIQKDFEFAIPAELRTAMRNTPQDWPSRPFRMSGLWIVSIKRVIQFSRAPDVSDIRQMMPEYIRSGALPHPDRIQQQPLIGQFKALSLDTAEQLRENAQYFDINAVLPSGLTTLVRAIVRGKLDMVVAALDLGADPNLCVSQSCPLHDAIASKDSATLVPLLLSRGADPDRVDSAVGVQLAPLAYAMFHARPLEIAELLRAKGADINGGQGEATPLMIAAEGGSKVLVKWLQKNNADWFIGSKDNVPPRLAITFATGQSKNAEFIKWFHGEWVKALKASGKWEWEGWIEQGGRRVPIGDSQVVLKREPFHIVVRIRPERRLAVAAAANAKHFAEVGRISMPNDLGRNGNIVSAIAVGAEMRDASSSFLRVNATSPDETGSYVIHSWGNNADGKSFSREDAVGVRTEYTRPVTELLVADTEVPIAEFKGKDLFVVMGTSVDVGHYLLEYYQPKRLHIRFQ